MVERDALKIADIFADSRLTEKDLDFLALKTILFTRDASALDRIEHFLDRFLYHRNGIEFGQDLDTLDSYQLYLEA